MNTYRMLIGGAILIAMILVVHAQRSGAQTMTAIVAGVAATAAAIGVGANEARTAP